ncbi:hypothetical protein [Bacillus benzoevorans]|uniref:Uncharacterized protein n=1 Tax=Bacillus benzoevorans TaxID=1456 RepID=A0A7X0HT34_9BACI|nr:hypothetical protein [Bacillus benzoevorans]
MKRINALLFLCFDAFMLFFIKLQKFFSISFLLNSLYQEKKKGTILKEWRPIGENVYHLYKTH